ncbi:MAG: cysteine--tRNA ligase [Gammaproteobacteria bacterium]
MLKIYNTMARSKQEFVPMEPGKVKMYVCGITVYDYCHLGHARMLLVFDMVTRYLRERGYDVTYVRNITDVDDKIINRARENGETITALTERFIDAMNEDADALGILRPDLEPRATEYMARIIAMITDLIKNGYGYVADNGDVYYDVSKFEGYGSLSGKHPEDLRAGARVEVQEAKDDPLDFVLWKSAKEDEPGWDSPWGEGRPGWHIECSAMSVATLGATFDIHGGGQDLQFPHHENEIAQSCGATGEPFARLWMHNGFIRIDDEKMSKSLGNFFTVREVLKNYQPEVIRFFILSSHYRSPLNYSDANLTEARTALGRLYTALRDVPADDGTEIDETYAKKFHAVMEDDFNSREAITLLHEIAHEINKSADKKAGHTKTLAATLRRLGGILGLLQDTPESFLQSGHSGTGPDNEAIQRMVDERAAAKQEKDYARADSLRQQLTEQGIILEDTPNGTIWRRS